MDATVDLDGLLERGEKHARRMLLERREESLRPFYFLVGDDGKHTLIPIMWSNDVQKQLAVAAIKDAARKAGAVAALLVHETWRLDTRYTKRPWAGERPAESPDRMEAVQIVAMAKGQTRERSLHIVRDRPGGRIVSLVPLAPVPEGVLGGLLIEGIIP